MENISSIYNSSLLRMMDVTTTVAPHIAVRNSSVANKVASNAYEWRFVLPPYFLIFLLSVTGNCLVIATLASNRRMRTVTNVYLLNLAISDFLLGVFCLPFTLVGQVYRRFLFGAAMCKLIPFLQAISVSVDVWTLVAISLERYFAICRPLKSRKWQTQCHAYKMIAMVWFLSVMLNSPILIVSTLQPMKGDAYKCREVWNSPELERTFNLGLDGALLLVPFFVMSVAYSLIVTKLWRGMRHEIQHNFNWQRHLTRQEAYKTNHLLPSTPMLKSNSEDLCCKKWNQKKITKDTEPQNSDAKSTQSYCMHTMDMEFRHFVRSTHIDKSIEAKRKVIRMLFVIILEFFVCWTPLHVINTIYLFYPEELYQYIGSKGVVSLQLLAYCSSCCNPITYCFMNRKFRQAFISLFKTCKLFRICFREESEGGKQVAPPLVSSSQEVTACVMRGSHTGRSGRAGFISDLSKCQLIDSEPRGHVSHRIGYSRHNYRAGCIGSRGLCLAAVHKAPPWAVACTRRCPRRRSSRAPSHRSSKQAKKAANSCTASRGHERQSPKPQDCHDMSKSCFEGHRNGNTCARTLV